MNGTAKRPPKWKLEYLTFRPSMLHPPSGPSEPAGSSEDGAEMVAQEGRFVYPIPVKQLPKSLRAANVTKSKFAPYEMEDLTIPSWLKLVRKLGQAKNEKLRKKFREYMYMGAGEEL